MKDIDNIFEQRRAGLITEAEALAELERLDIHGAFDTSGGYTGFDYIEQTWVIAP